MKGYRVLPAGESAKGSVQGETKPPQRILVIDDDSVIRQFSAETLMRAGFHVHTAEDGAAGWEALQVNRYDLLITDNNMPKFTGIELVRKLRGKDVDLPVILASGTIPTEDLKQFPWLKFAATLLKPYTSEALLDTVESVLHAVAEAKIFAQNYVPNAAENVSQATRRGR